MEKIYKELIEKINEYKEELSEISKKIHGYAELAFNEYLSSELLEDALEKYGFKALAMLGADLFKDQCFRDKVDKEYVRRQNKI